MAIGSLPEDGELRLGPVSLPAGKRVRAGHESRVPVAWVTVEEVPDPGSVWAALSDVGQDTGLVPILLGGMFADEEEMASFVAQFDPEEAANLRRGGPLRPWDEEEFDPPADVSHLDRTDAASVLADLWHGKTGEGDEEDEGEGEDEEFAEHIAAAVAPFSRQFPGLAPAGERALSEQERDDVLRSLPAARIGLVPASRPADVLPLIGWSGIVNQFPDALPVAAVLRSWEERFGARLLQVGFAWIRLLADRPPRSVAHAQRIAAEQYAFCDECAGQGLTEVSTISASLMESPIWTFWWD